MLSLARRHRHGHRVCDLGINCERLTLPLVGNEGLETNRLSQLLVNRLGQQQVLIIFGMLLFTLAVLGFLSWVLVHFSKSKLGRKAYFLAPVPFLLAGLALFAEVQREKPNEGPPRVLTASKLSGLIRGLPQYAHFSLTGLSYFGDNLYVGTNVGIAEVSSGKVTHFYQFQSQDSVVSGPWLDRKEQILWATDDHTNELLRYDGRTWTRMREPTPPKGYYSRGDVLNGVRPIGNREGFWLAAAGSAWRWASVASEWQNAADNVGLPDDKNKFGEVIGVLPVGDAPLLIVSRELLPGILLPGQDFSSDELVDSRDPSASSIVRDGKPFLSDTWAVGGNEGYICTKEKNLVQVTTERVTPLDAPGPCEALATDDDWSLVVSIKGKGIYLYTKGEWSLIAGSPYPSAAGEYWTYLSASGGKLALAIDAKPVMDTKNSRDLDMHFIQNAPTSLWVYQDGKFAPVGF